MTTVSARPTAPSPRSTGATRRGLVRMLRPIVLLPVGLGTLARAAAGRAHPASRVAAAGLVSVVAGVVGLVELGLFGLFAARGLLYGIVVGGPYDHAWGGPTLAGAWAVHAVVALGGAVVAAGLGLLVSVLHDRLTDGLLHGRRVRRVPAGVIALSVFLTAAVAAFVVAWVRQL